MVSSLQTIDLNLSLKQGEQTQGPWVHSTLQNWFLNAKREDNSGLGNLVHLSRRFTQ